MSQQKISGGVVLKHFLHILLSFAMIAALAGCAANPMHKPLPKEALSSAVVKGYKANIRSWGDEAAPNLDSSIAKRIGEYKTTNNAYFESHQSYPAMEYLALSGGGNDGAFGAGILCGWTKAGTRPQFAIVSGVSTGALIAPFAFLGSDYDDELKELYTTLKSENIFVGTISTVLDGITGGLALTDSTPLMKKIEESVTPAMFKRIGEEHRKGRRLLIATTNIEAQRSVIWDMGAIANSSQPDALKLFHKIMLASASIPGAFKPVFIDVTVNGQTYNEMHADGGVTSQVFIYPLQSTSREMELFKESGIARKLYIIRNTKITPEYQPLDPGLFSLTQRSVETLIKTQGVGDLYRLYIGAQRDNIDYNLVYLPSDFTAVSEELFDPVYMTKVYDLGYKMGSAGIQWYKKPPNVEYVDVEQGLVKTGAAP